jgi:hypothetical protein
MYVSEPEDAERLAEFLRELHFDARQQGGIVTVEAGGSQVADAAIVYARSWSRGTGVPVHIE